MDQQNKIFIGNLPWSIKKDQLRELFSSFGDIVEAIVIEDQRTGRSKGFGFVTFATAESASAAVQEMHEKEIEGRKILVSIARPREERPQRENRQEN